MNSENPVTVLVFLAGWGVACAGSHSLGEEPRPAERPSRAVGVAVEEWAGPTLRYSAYASSGEFTLAPHRLSTGPILAFLAPSEESRGRRFFVEAERSSMAEGDAKTEFTGNVTLLGDGISIRVPRAVFNRTAGRIDGEGGAVVIGARGRVEAASVSVRLGEDDVEFRGRIRAEWRFE